ncbi:hypothetical protein V6N11_052686 [Hibiscus sabdariffa]|uniref:OTU domain-containing protein n=1 Tax=Hibiscus sabdariffa TaxID=183260 RepID=A0ABR2UAS3_9ROSI
MITCDIDPDVVRWGLQDLQVCVFSHSGASASVTQYDKDDSQTGYIREVYHGPEHVNVENDAFIAYALQEELSRLAAAEASGFNNPSQDSILAQDWVGLPGRQHSSDHEHDQKIIDHNQGHGNEVKNRKWDLDDPIISRCEQGGDYCTVDKISPDEDMLHIDIIDQSSVLDGQVEKRLNDMVAIPHVPKINGEIPSVDEVMSDHQRLLDRFKETVTVSFVLYQINFTVLKITTSLLGSKLFTRLVGFFLKSNSEMYEGYVPMAYGDYLKKMNKNGEWGDHVALQAAADLYGVKIFVLTSFKDTCYIEILPHCQKSERIVFLSFWAEVHYNSIYPEEELPMLESKKKKKWWIL